MDAMRMLTIGRTDDGYLIADAGGEGVVDVVGLQAGQGDMFGASSESELRSILKTKYQLPEKTIEAAMGDLKDPRGSTVIPL
jgi:hypothetical protein